MSKARFKTITITPGQTLRGIQGMTVIGVKQGEHTELVLEAPAVRKQAVRKQKPAAAPNKATSFDPGVLVGEG